MRIQHRVTCVVVTLVFLSLTPVAQAQSTEDEETTTNISGHREIASIIAAMNPATTSSTKLQPQLRKLFRQIKTGMTRAAVEELLGQPLSELGEKVSYIRWSERTLPIVGSPWGFGGIHIEYDSNQKVASKRLNHQYVDPLPAELDVQAMPAVTNSIYVKVYLPQKPQADNKRHIESWVSKQLSKQGIMHVAAMTDWIKLPEGGLDSVPVWNGNLSEGSPNCPVECSPVELLSNGQIKIRLTGWGPIAPIITNNTLTPDSGNRRLAVVNLGTHKAFFAILVTPPTP